MPRLIPYKDCALLNDVDKHKIDHEIIQHRRLETMDLNSKSRASTLDDFTKKDFERNDYSNTIDIKRNLPNESLKYVLNNAHSKIIESRPLSP